MISNYNTDYIVTYSYYDKFLRENFHSDEVFDINDVIEFEDLSNEIYRVELLTVFNITDIDHLTNKYLMDFEDYIKNTNMKKILPVIDIFCQNRVFICDTPISILFSYDYFFLTHKCIQSLYYNNLNEFDKYLDKLIEYISKK